MSNWEMHVLEREAEALKAEANKQAEYITQLMTETGDSLMKQKQAEAERDRLRVLLQDCYDTKIFGHGLSDLHESSPLVKRINTALNRKEAT